MEWEVGSGEGGLLCEQEVRQAEVVESIGFAVVLGSFEGQQGYLGTARSPPACLWGFLALSPVFWGEKLLSHLTHLTWRVEGKHTASPRQ